MDGKRTIGFNVIQGFYAQHQLEALHADNEILEELKQAGSGKTEQELRGVLGCFLFSADDQFKKIKVLSGGEKSRVALAKTLISEANFLLLDEPTNHLDFISENILIQALNQYAGTFVVVSHNRYFISQIANKIWYIENYQIKEYPGTYEEYEYWRKTHEANAAPPVKAESQKVKPAVKRESSPSNDHALKKLAKDLKAAEEQIEKLQTSKAAVEMELVKPEVYSKFEALSSHQSELNKIKDQIDALNDRWEKLVLEIDELEAKA